MHISKRTGVLLLTTSVVVVLGLVLLLPKHKTQTVQAEPQVSQAPLQFDDNTVAVKTLIDNINLERSSNHLPPLGTDENLVDCATSRNHDMFNRQYYGHHDPQTGTLIIDDLKAGAKCGPAVKGFDENVAFNVDDVDLIPSWMASPEHKANLLDPNVNYVGVMITNSNQQVTFHDTEDGTSRTGNELATALFAQE